MLKSTLKIFSHLTPIGQPLKVTFFYINLWNVFFLTFIYFFTAVTIVTSSQQVIAHCFRASPLSSVNEPHNCYFQIKRGVFSYMWVKWWVCLPGSGRQGPTERVVSVIAGLETVPMCRARSGLSVEGNVFRIQYELCLTELSSKTATLLSSFFTGCFIV